MPRVVTRPDLSLMENAPARRPMRAQAPWTGWAFLVCVSRGGIVDFKRIGPSVVNGRKLTPLQRPKIDPPYTPLAVGLTLPTSRSFRR